MTIDATYISELTEEQLIAAEPFIHDVVEAAQAAKLGGFNRDKFRATLHLGRTLNPTITELPGIVLPLKSKSLADRVKDGGYDWVNEDITADRFPITLDAGPRPLVLAHFGVLTETAEIKRWANANGYEVALHEDLLAIGSHKKYKDLQRKFQIIQLGSCPEVNGIPSVIYLNGSAADRTVDVYYLYCDIGWIEDFRVLLVRKVA